MYEHTPIKKTIVELEKELKALEEQERIFDAEQELKNKRIAFRDKVLKQIDDDVTLDDILEEMEKKSLCKRISVWVTRDF